MTFQTTQSEDGFDEAIYSVDEVKEDRHCSHHFVRVAANRVECTKCHAGFMDAGDFPLDEINLFYSEPKTRKYFENA